MLSAIELTAVITSAIYGVFLGRHKNFDIVGLFTVACLVAFGGGTLRDLFLDRHPLFWIANSHYLPIVFGIAVLGALLPPTFGRIKPFLHVPDALGLALFTIVGTAYAQEAGTSLFIAALLGAVTGTFGGVLGEVVCNEVPSLFRSAPLYATCSFVGAWLYLLGLSLPLDPSISALAAATVIVLFRLAAVYWNLRLPESTPPEGS